MHPHNKHKTEKTKLAKLIRRETKCPMILKFKVSQNKIRSKWEKKEIIFYLHFICSITSVLFFNYNFISSILPLCICFPLSDPSLQKQ